MADNAKKRSSKKFLDKCKNLNLKNERPFDNSAYPEFHNAAMERNKGDWIPRPSHPLKDVNARWKIPDMHLKAPRTCFKADIPEDFESVLVMTKPQFDAMMISLEKETLWMVDLEFALKHGYYREYPSLLQIAVSQKIYLVDLFEVWGEIQRLKPFLESPDYSKVMHGSNNDRRQFQVYWDIYPIGIIDTQIVGRHLFQEPNIGLAKICSELIPGMEEVPLDKTLQVSEWESRPIPPAQLMYAKQDVMVLWRLWNNITFLTSERLGELREKIEADLRKFNETIHKPILRGNPYKMLEAVKWKHPNMKTMFVNMYLWREQIARRTDRWPQTLPMIIC